MIADAAFPAHEKAAAAKVDTYDEITIAAPRRGRKRRLVLMAGGAVAATCLVALLFLRTGSDQRHTSPQAVVSSPTSTSQRASSIATGGSTQTAPTIPAPPVDESPVAAPVASTPTEDRQPPVQPAATDVAPAPEKSQEPASLASRPAQSNARKTTTHKAPQPAKAGAIVRDVPF
jgi:cytoskeletal protein RodZ